MLLDKTGTITEGRPTVTDVVPADGVSTERLLALAAGLERGSEHPLAAAISAHAAQEQVDPMEISDFAARPGRGLSGVDTDGNPLLFGNAALMQENDIALGDLAEPAQALSAAAKTPMFLSSAGVLAGIVAVSDRIHGDSQAAIHRLHQSGIRVVMLTGDNADTARAVAAAAGIDDYMANVMPEEKAEKVSSLQAQGEVVGMTGDGINDAPALARADVGFAIGSGTDVAIESADITLMRESLHGLADAVSISRATLRNIRQNLFGAFVYNTAGIPIAAGILYPFFGVLLSPVIAGAAMALSSVTVVSNAGRLRFFQPEKD